MNSKNYIILCDNTIVYKKFTNNIGMVIQGVTVADYNELKFNIVNRVFNNTLSPTNTQDVKVVDRIVDVVNKHNNSIFDKLVSFINSCDYRGVHLIIRVDSLRTMTKLKRLLKRPNYKTVHISDTMPISKELKAKRKAYKVDSRIQYLNNEHLTYQCRKFTNKHMPTFNIIRND